MKTLKITFLGIALCAIISSCQEKEIEINEPKDSKAILVGAKIADSQTKTSLDNLTFKWAANDNLSIFHDNSGVADNEQFTIKSSAQPYTSCEQFEGTISDWTSGNKTFYGIYPYNETTGNFDLANETYSFELPATQTQKYKDDGTLDITGIGSYLYMMGKESNVPYSEDVKLSMDFENVTSIIDLELTEVGERTVQKVMLSASAPIFPDKSTVLFSDGSQTQSDFDYSLNVKLENAPSGNLTVRFVTFPITIPKETILTVVVFLKESDNTTYHHYSMIKQDFESDIVLSAGKRKTSTIAVPTAQPSYINLSLSGTSNCYLANTYTNYYFKVNTIGNGTAGLLGLSKSTTNFHTDDITIAPKSAEVLWQDVEGLITITHLYADEGALFFNTSANEGNAIIAVYSGEDCTGDILWSWHIWCTDSPVENTYINNAGKTFVALDRNIGAISSTTGTGKDEEIYNTYGLLYQWGRKDPFPPSATYNSNVEKTIYGQVKSITKTQTSSALGTIANTIKHPDEYYYNANSPYDWRYNSEGGNYLWGNPYGYNYAATVPYSADGVTESTVFLPHKSIYDPCPVGYMVPPIDTWTRFTTTGQNSNVPADFNVSGTFGSGWNFYYNANQVEYTWYPACGGRSYENGNINDTGVCGNYWNSSSYGSESNNSSYATLAGTYVNHLNNSGVRSLGFSIRCVKE